jgi:hypothetical protein
VSWTSRLNVDSLTRAYAFANTPAYLYRHFRGDDSVQAIARDVHPDALVEVYNRVNLRHLKDIGDVVLAYAAMVALSMSGHEAAKVAFASLTEEGLDWAKALKELASMSSEATRTIVAPGPRAVQGFVPRITTQSVSHSQSSSSVKPKWKAKAL